MSQQHIVHQSCTALTFAFMIYCQCHPTLILWLLLPSNTLCPSPCPLRVLKTKCGRKTLHKVFFLSSSSSNNHLVNCWELKVLGKKSKPSPAILFCNTVFTRTTWKMAKALLKVASPFVACVVCTSVVSMRCKVVKIKLSWFFLGRTEPSSTILSGWCLDRSAVPLLEKVVFLYRQILKGFSGC